MLSNVMSSTVKQLLLFDAETEAQLYHNSSAYGFFSILYKYQDSTAQRSYRLPLMAEVLPLLPRDRDTWLSQAEFTQPNRRIVNLARLPLLFVDLDCYNLTPETALSSLLYFCDDAGLPHPSIVIFSGRGLQAKWLLETPLQRWALPRWNAAQSKLVEAFTVLHSDPMARDASRVLRLVNTTNTKSGETVRVVHTTADSAGQPARYDFDYLCEILLPPGADNYDKKSNNHPYTLEQQQFIATARENREKRVSLKVVQGSNTSGLHRFSGRRLAWDRLEDIRKLVELRGGVTQGQSMSTLFWALNFLLLSGATNSTQMFYEAKSISAEFGFGEFNRTDELCTLYSKAKQHEAGETVTFNGKEYPPLYTPKNKLLIELFQITDV